LLLRDSVYAVDGEEQTILHHLAQGSLTKDNWKFTRYYSQCIYKFLKRESMTGVEIQEYLDSQDILKNTALHYAIRQRFYKFVELLIKLGCRSDIPNLSGQTAAQLAQKDFKMSRIFKNIPKVILEYFSYKGQLWAL
jgi:ankyrin repeat protein